MFSRGNIHRLDRHLQTVRDAAQQEVFLVGGCVRDVLCGWTENPTDVDSTAAGDPAQIYAHFQAQAEKYIGLFRTEKYGTMTMIQESDYGNISYELTPFREEGKYEDTRHPSEVRWTSSLLADAGRRDFTVNCLYYTTYSTTPIDPTATPIGEALLVDSDAILKQLTQQGWSYVVGAQLLIIWSHDLIDLIIKEGKVDGAVLEEFFQSNTIPYTVGDTIGLLIDPMQGVRDLVAQKLQTVGNPDKRFHEDALRILRALRFVNIRNQHDGARFDFHKDTRTSIKKCYHLIPYLAKERIHDEIVKVFSHRNPFGYVALLDEANLLQYIFPALHRCKHNDQPIRYHPFDTYTHTMLTLRHLQQINDHYLVKLGMLYHDVGKPDQYYYYAQCKTPEELAAVHGSWANHVTCGPDYVIKDFGALAFASAEIDEIARYVAMHMRPGQILDAREDNQRKKIRTMYSEYGYDRVHNLFDICVSDRRGQYNPIQGQEIDAVRPLYAELDYLRDHEGQFTKKELAVDGYAVMQALGIPAGPMVGEYLDKAFQRVLHEKDARNKPTTIITYLQGLVPHAEA